ncbi:LacI family DNA-binding transcriptional regulator [Tessaracoccus flavus]|uniref:Uncharacterized protein n=1 Tax=Tessaracoccus flavus TaxID=1610493 RepID=A0A1Q2CHR5_9ACTN|nr:LacI family DNA-binding transcriptional regulator [Tessaracoccus flavus]AQP45666.1 hypothetical protein RPIT_13305 [Tessaracoccus flavus]SDY75706.1 transcriptional regulator, LacI family [Tessaracoccus flavus]
MKPTIDDVARAAGLSRGTVSRYLNGGKDVSPRASLAVESAIVATGYSANPHARRLRGSRTGAVALLLPASVESLFADPVFAIMAKECSRALRRLNSTMVLLMADDAEEHARARDFVRGGHVDGVLALNVLGDGAALVEELALSVPVAAAAYPGMLGPRVGCVSADDREASERATRLLMDAGCRRIAHIAGPTPAGGRNPRLEGFEAALGEAFDPDLVVQGDYTYGTARVVVEELLARAAVDGIVAANDFSAFAALDALRERGVDVPSQVRVIGMDDLPAASTTSPPLTTMAQDFVALAEALVEMLEAKLSGLDPDPVLLPMHLVVRSSA